MAIVDPVSDVMSISDTTCPQRPPRPPHLFTKVNRCESTERRANFEKGNEKVGLSHISAMIACSRTCYEHIKSFLRELLWLC